MSNPERIWLQPGAETTWCKDRINDDDVGYVRADIAAATIERLTKELGEALQRGVVLAIKSEKNEHRTTMKNLHRTRRSNDPIRD